VTSLKLKKGFITHETDGEHYTVAAGEQAEIFHGLIRSNETAAAIINQLKKETTIDKITDALCKLYDAPREVIKNDVSEIIMQLRAIGALDE